MLLSIVLAVTVVSLVSLVGGLFILRGKGITEETTFRLVGLAAGVMLTTAFLDLLPEALQGTRTHSSILFFTFLGVVSFFFLERFILWFHHHDSPHGLKPSALLILFGDGLHNFLDGTVIATAFLVSPTLGVSATVAIIAHEIPQEIADFGILIRGGMGTGRALLFNFISALTAFLGALVGYFSIKSVENVSPLFLGFGAGMFIYIACSDLIPDLHNAADQHKGWRQFAPFLAGIILMVLVTRFLAA